MTNLKNLLLELLEEQLGVIDFAQFHAKRITKMVDFKNFHHFLYFLNDNEYKSKNRINIFFLQSNNVAYLIYNNTYDKESEITVNIDVLKEKLNTDGLVKTKHWLEEILAHELIHFYENIVRDDKTILPDHKTPYYAHLTLNQFRATNKEEGAVQNLNYLLYITTEEEISATINQHYNQIKSVGITKKSFIEHTMNRVFNPIFGYYLANKVKFQDIDVESNELLTNYLFYFKRNYYRGLTNTEIYKRLYQKIDIGVERYRRKLLRLADLLPERIEERQFYKFE